MDAQIVDRDRLAAVADSGLIDTPPEVQFDEITRAAATMLRAPFAFMTAVDDRRSFWKSAYGIEDGTNANAVEDSFCQYVIRTDDPLIVGDATADPVTSSNPSIESMGVRAWAGHPVHYRGQVIGSFCVVDVTPRTWSDSDRDVLRRLTEVAEREIEIRAQLRSAQSAIANADLRARQYSELVDTLRSSLLPPSLPTIPGLDVCSWYGVADDGDALLGDFYDVFPLPDDRWGVVIGDVCGHGAAAARLTSLARYTMRTAASLVDDPGGALAIVDAAIKADLVEENRFATMFFATIRADADGFVVDYARGGHQHPIVRRGDGSTELLEGGAGPLVGIVPNPTFGCAQMRLDPGDSILLYTDGLTECRAADGNQLGHEPVRAALASAPPGAQAALDAVIGALDGHADRRADDIAMIALHVPA